MRLLAQALDPSRHRIEIVACRRPEAAVHRAHVRPEASGVPVDRTPYDLSVEDTVAYLASKLPAYEIVVSCQNVADLYPALERLHLRPALIDYGGQVSDALAGPKHLTARYVGTCAAVRAAAAGRMPAGRDHHAVEIPSLADTTTSSFFRRLPLIGRFGAPWRGRAESAKAAAVVARWERLFAQVLAERPPKARPAGLFRSFLQGGFESSTHRRAHDRQRIDMIAASHHDVHAEHDYRALARHNILTMRDGLRWHLIEREPGRYDWSSLDRQLAAARATGSEMIWDLLHYGWPDDIDIWTPAFVTRFAAFAAAAARHIGPAAAGERRFYAPVNEISFFAWGGGDAAYLNPFAMGRGFELKVQLARASIAAMEAILLVDPAARFVHADPVINVVADPLRPQDAAVALGHRLAQYQAWDMIAGRMWPQIGGRSKLLDIVGVNFYHNNQWVHEGPQVPVDHPLAKPFRETLAETYARYGRPIFVAETGIEGDARAAWLGMIMAEVEAATAMGVPVEGVCLYPILDHPGWDDGRYCPNGLLTCAQTTDGRQADPILAAAIAALQVKSPRRDAAGTMGVEPWQEDASRRSVL